MVKSKYIPHQGKREKERRRKKLGLPDPIPELVPYEHNTDVSSEPPPVKKSWWKKVLHKI